MLDVIRKGEEAWEPRIYSGFDPDLHTSGLASVNVRLSSTGRKRICGAWMTIIKVPARLKGTRAAEKMCHEISKRSEVDFFTGHFATVEGQQLYPKEEDTRQKLVAVGNDLIALALVSGAAAHAFIRHDVKTSILLPREWKGNIKKTPQHVRAHRLIEAQKVTLRLGDKFCPKEDLVRASSHAMDALCMALRSAGYTI